jgi:enoyl-CoA hydratase/carnithine racemase
MEWVITGRVFSAQEAFENGLVSRVVSQEKLLTTAQELAREIADNTSAVSVALSRQLLWRMLGAGHPIEARKIDSKCTYYMAQSLDGSEGIASFLEKRPPMFKMKPSKDMPNFYPWWEDRPLTRDQ